MLTELITKQLRWEPLPPNQEAKISFEEVSSAFPDCILWLLSKKVEGVEYVSCELRLVERRCAQPLESPRAGFRTCTALFRDQLHQSMKLPPVCYGGLRWGAVTPAEKQGRWQG